MAENFQRDQPRSYLILSLETAPVKLDDFLSLDKEARKDLINPIDSKIIALGIRYEGKNKVFHGEDEWRLLKEFWHDWNDAVKGKGSVRIVGFNISSFDLPFLTTRSFIKGVPIIPFSGSQVIDLRDKISAYRYGRVRGKLREYGSLLGIKEAETETEDTAELYRQNQFEKIKSHLENNLLLIEALYKRAIETNIINLGRW